MLEKSSPLSTTPSPVDLQQALEKVRASKEFSALRQDDPMESLKNIPAVRQLLDQLSSTMDQLMNTLREWISHLKLPVSGEHSSVLSQVYLYAMIGLIIFMAVSLLYILLSILRKVYMGYEKRPAQPRTAPDGTVLLNSQSHLSQAHILAGNGEFEKAIHQLYLAMLCHLDETKQVPYETTRTNLEYLAELRSKQAQANADAFKVLAQSFEAIHYGSEPRGEKDYETCRTTYHVLQREPSSAGGPPPRV